MTTDLDRARAALDALKKSAWRPRFSVAAMPQDVDECLVLDLSLLPEAVRGSGVLTVTQDPLAIRVEPRGSSPLPEGSVGRWWGREVLGYEPFTDAPSIDECSCEGDETLELIFDELGPQEASAGDKLGGYPGDALELSEGADGERLDIGELPRCEHCDAELDHLLTIDAGILPATTAAWGQGRAMVMRCKAHDQAMRVFLHAVW